MGATVEAGHAMVLGERVVRPADKVFRVIRRFEMVVSVKRTVRPTLLRRDRGSRNFFVKLCMSAVHMICLASFFKKFASSYKQAN